MHSKDLWIIRRLRFGKGKPMFKCSKLAAGDERTLQVCKEMSVRGYLKKEFPTTRHDFYNLVFETANSDYYSYISKGKNPFNEPSSFVSFLSQKGIRPKWFFARDDLIGTFKKMADNEHCSNDRLKNLDCVKYVIISLLVYLRKEGVIKGQESKADDIPEYSVDDLPLQGGARCTEASNFLFGSFLIATGLSLAVYEDRRKDIKIADHAFVGYPLSENELLYIEPFGNIYDSSYVPVDPKEYKNRREMDMADFYVDSEIQFITLPQKQTSDEEKLAALKELLVFEPLSYRIYQNIGGYQQDTGRNCEAIDSYDHAYRLFHADKLLLQIEDAIKWCQFESTKERMGSFLSLTAR